MDGPAAVDTPIISEDAVSERGGGCITAPYGAAAIVALMTVSNCQSGNDRTRIFPRADPKGSM